MADGDYLSRAPLPASGRSRTTYLLVDNATANTNGLWVDVSVFTEVFITIADANGAASFGANVTIHGSNETAQPLATNDGVQLTPAAVTSPDYISHSVLPVWMKAKVASWTSGTIRVILAGKG